VIYAVIGVRHHSNIFLMASIVIIAINCCIAHHMIEIEYNIFTVSLLSSIVANESNLERVNCAQ